MNVVDRGTGVPIVVIPGVQGRWEWMAPGIDALARQGRVITFSLADEPTAQARFDAARGFWSYVDQVRDALDVAGIERAAICGVSYGGLIASAFAARHPDRISALVLVSALPPTWTPDRRVAFYLRAPWLLTPLFCLGALRLYREIAAANTTWWRGVVAAAGLATNALCHMFHPGRMAERVRLLGGVEIDSELAHVTTPVLIVTGEDVLDLVVHPRQTRQYLEVLPHARVVTLAMTGHLGFVTRPAEFADLVGSFAAEHAGRATDPALPDPGSRIPDQGPPIPGPRSLIPGSPIPDPRSPIPDSRRRVG